MLMNLELNSITGIYVNKDAVISIDEYNSALELFLFN